MPKVNIGALNLHYLTVGHGPDMVMIHGFLGNLAVWHLNIAPALLPGGEHVGPLEQPELLTEHIRTFCGLPPEPAGTKRTGGYSIAALARGVQAREQEA